MQLTADRWCCGLAAILVVCIGLGCGSVQRRHITHPLYLRFEDARLRCQDGLLGSVCAVAVTIMAAYPMMCALTVSVFLPASSPPLSVLLRLNLARFRSLCLVWLYMAPLNDVAFRTVRTREQIPYCSLALSSKASHVISLSYSFCGSGPDRISLAAV